MMRGALILAAAVLAGCATAPPSVIHAPVRLPLPSRPVLAPMSASAVRCLSAATYTLLVQRQRALRTWALELRAIIRANNAHVHKAGGTDGRP